jgi:ABC-type dipeptide/oligopeptide/nickel transport system permease component/ABC-type dipeptide/oligopeptide/nickel transport system permease subunit
VPFLWILATIGIFWLLYVAPDRDPVQIIAGRGATVQQVERLRDELGLDDSYPRQYFDWITGMFRGDFGEEFRSEKPVRDELQRRLPPTIEFVALTVAFCVLVTLGAAWMISRVGPASPLPAMFTAGLAAIPVVTAITALIIYPLIWFTYAMPVGGYVAFYDEPWTNIRLFVPPAIVCGLIVSGLTLPLARRIILCSERSDASSVPVALAAATMALPFVLSADLIAERVLSIEGVGNWLFTATFIRDLPVARTVLTLIALVALVGWAFAWRLPDRERHVTPASVARSPVLIAGAVLIVVFVIAGFVGPWLGPNDPRAFSATERFESPSFDHPFGTTAFGQDVLARVLASGQVALKMSLPPLFLGLLPGAVVGFAISRLGQRAAAAALEAGALFNSLPLLPLILAFISGLDPGLHAIVAAVTVGAFATGLMLAPTLASFDLDRSEGWGAVATTLCAGAALVVSTAILAEVTTSYLGLGAIPGRPSFGMELAQSASRAAEFDYLFYIPAIVITVILLGFFLVRRALDDVHPPQMFER